MKKLTAIIASALAAGCAKHVVLPPQYEKIAEPPAIVEQKVPEHYLTITKGKKPRQDIIDAGLSQHNVYLFGDYLDEMVDATSGSSRNIVKLKIPEFFFKEMDWKLVANLDKHILTLYNHDKPIMNSEINCGGWNYDNRIKKYKMFKTPTGTFYISRIVMYPFYYNGFFSRTPKKMFRPGKKNPYGIVMMDPSLEPVTPTYDFKPEKHAGFNIHSTNAWKGPGNDSHSCVRVNPPKMEEFGLATLFYYALKDYVKNGRGKIYKLKKAIPISIIGDNSPQ